MNGNHEVRRVAIDDSLLGDDKDMLEDLIASACNDAVRRIADKMQDSMSGLDLRAESAARLQDALLIMSRGLVQELIEALRCLPGVGPKSAQRMAFHLLERDRAGGMRLGGGPAARHDGESVIVAVAAR